MLKVSTFYKNEDALNAWSWLYCALSNSKDDNLYGGQFAAQTAIAAHPICILLCVYWNRNLQAITPK
jgi:hypothetical protein